MTFKATIKRRSGHHTREHQVVLDKDPRDYRLSEQFGVVIDGRTIPVHVEGAIDKEGDILSVA